jgi:hypothetical protein
MLERKSACLVLLVLFSASNLAASSCGPKSKRRVEGDQVESNEVRAASQSAVCMTRTFWAVSLSLDYGSSESSRGLNLNNELLDRGSSDTNEPISIVQLASPFMHYCDREPTR